jgi:tRNA modification GTPase
MASTDTIAAIATAAGVGGIGIIRISGEQVPAVAIATVGVLPPPRLAVRALFRDGAGRLIDDGLILYFPAPASFTGEHVLELHAHGGPVVLDLLLQRVLELGARQARPGEFSERAFLNGKLDLVQAEAIADLITSHSAAAARAAMASLQGEFSRLLQELSSAILSLRTYLEAAIDFPDDEVDWLADADIDVRLQALLQRCESIGTQAAQGRLLREGASLVIAGPPNVGKSSLLNRLAGEEVAIVTDIAGTTRDLLRTQIQIDGLAVQVIDTAGLRETEDVVEREGIRRARAAMADADRILLMLEASDPDDGRVHLAGLPELPVTRVRNKIDLYGHAPACSESPSGPTIHLSARTGVGIDLLRAHLKQAFGYGGAEGVFSARRRHLQALARAQAHLAQAQQQWQAGAGELVAEELRLAQQQVGEITGQVTNEDLLGQIFSTFCLGK